MKFSVGEIAEIGSEDCEIAALPGHGKPQYHNDQYLISIPSAINHHEVSGLWSAKECELRKKKPPEELSSWDKIEELTNWNPREVHNA